MISIRTTRTSAVVAAFVHRFPDAIAHINGAPMNGPVESWCTNARLRGAVDFSLRRTGTDLLGFHDDARNMWAAAETLEIVQLLAAQKVLRFSQSNSTPLGGGRIFLVWLLGIVLLLLMVFVGIKLGLL